MNQTMDVGTFIFASIRNKPGRNLATAFCFAFIAANIFSAQVLMAGSAAGVERGLTRMGADQLVVPIEYMASFPASGSGNTVAIVRVDPSPFRFNASIMDSLGKVTGISGMSPQLYVTTLDLPEFSSSPVEIFGIDPLRDFTIQPWLRQPLNKPLGPDEIIVGDGINGEISSGISLNDHVYTIVGRLDPTQSASDQTLFLRLDDAYTFATAGRIGFPPQPQISRGDINAVLVRDSAGEDPHSVETRIRRSLSSSSAPKSGAVIGQHFALDPVSREMQDIPAILNIISVLVVIAALPLIALIAAMVAQERQREIGLLKSMGAKKKDIFFIVIAESLVLAATGGIAGVGASFAALFLLNMLGILNSALLVSFQMPASPDIGMMAGLALFVVIAIGTLSSLWPAYRSSTMNPYDAIRNE